MSIDYKALMQDRLAKQTRPIVRHPICLVPELSSDLDEANAVLNELLAESVRNHEDDPGEDPRAGALSPLGVKIVEARKVVAEADARAGEVTVVGVFKAPTAKRQGQQSDEKDRLNEASPDKGNEIWIDYATSGVLEAFDHFEDPAGHRLPDLDGGMLARLVEEWSQGELLALHNKILVASTGVPNIPLSVRRSLEARRSAATSK